MFKNFKGRGKFWLIPLFVIGFVVLGGGVVLWLWNAIIPGLIPGVGYLTLPKAIGLLVLCRLLFGGFRGGGRHRQGGSGFANRNGKYCNLDDAEKERLRDKWKKRMEE